MLKRFVSFYSNVHFYSKNACHVMHATQRVRHSCVQSDIRVSSQTFMCLGRHSCVQY